MDIRKFFQSSAEKCKLARKPSANGDNKKNSRKRILIDSDSDDEPIKTPKRNNKQSTKSSAKKAKDEDRTSSKYFEVSKEKVKSLFGTEPVKQVPQKPDDKTTAAKELADISEAFLDMDDDAWGYQIVSPVKTPVKKPQGGSTPENLVSLKATPPSVACTSPQRRQKIRGEVTSEGKHEMSPSPKKEQKPASTPKKDGFNVTKQNCSVSSVKPIFDEANRKTTPTTKHDHKKTKEPKKHVGAASFYGSPSSTSATSVKPAPSFSDLPERPVKDPQFNLWVEKHKPASLKQIIGQQGEKSNVNKLIKWLRAWHGNQSGNKKVAKPNHWAKDDSGAYFKAALLSGPPGIGKTTTAHLVCKELSLDVVEFNASDTRSKKLLHTEITELLSSKSLSLFAQGGAATSKHHVLIMDEVDGMAGNEDRGGIQELISLIKGSKVPIICMCNDRNHPKIRSLVNYCFDLRFSKPRSDQIKGAMMSICFKEGLKIKPDILNSIIAGTNQDIRLVLNHLSMLSAKCDAEMTVTNKELKLGAWDVLRKVFSESEHKDMTLYDKLDLFFNDYGIAPLFVFENYLNVVPHAKAAKSKRGNMELFAKAATSQCHGDLMDRAIRSQNAWSLLPTQALFSSFIPGELLEGHVGGMINFPAWLAKNSKKSKMDRLAQEIQSHTRLKASASNEAVKLDYARALRDSVVRPLVQNGSSGVEESLTVLREYSLLREDVESLNELSNWPGANDPMSSIESKVKAAFTRAYNKNPVMTPFSINVAGVKKGRGTQDSDGIDELYGEEAVDDAPEENEEDGELTADGMIMQAKKPTKTDTIKEPKNKKKDSAGPSKPRGGGGRGKRGKR